MLTIQLRQVSTGLYVALLLGTTEEVKAIDRENLCLLGTRYTAHKWKPLESCNYAIKLWPKYPGTELVEGDLRLIRDFLKRAAGNENAPEYLIEDLTAEDAQKQAAHPPITRKTHIINIHTVPFSDMATKPKVGRLVKIPSDISIGDFVLFREYEYLLWFIKVRTGRGILGQVKDIKLSGVGVPTGYQLLQIVNFSHSDFYYQPIGEE